MLLNTSCPQTNITLRQPLMGKKKMNSLIIRVYNRDDQNILNDTGLLHINSLLMHMVYKTIINNTVELKIQDYCSTVTRNDVENTTQVVCMQVYFITKEMKIMSFVHDINKAIPDQELMHLIFNYEVYNYDGRNAIKCEEGELKEIKGGKILERMDGDIVYHGNSSEFSDINDVPVVISWQNKNIAALNTAMCKIPTCELIKLKDTEYNKTDDGIEINLHGKVLHVRPHNFIFSNTSVLVCEHILSNMENQTDLYQEYVSSSLESILTLCGSILTMTTLVVTVVTYCVFPSLRTIPGLCVMSLSCTLFMAHLIFVTSGYFTSWPKVCFVIGIFIHYLWLSVFSWMFVMISDLSSTFVKMSLTTPGSKNIKKFILYCLIGWVFPILIVGPCVAFSITEYLPFQYGNDTSCWISGFWPLLGAFGIPILISVTLNLILFIRGAVYLRATMKIAEHAKAAKSKYDQLLLMIKLCSITGGTWIFGFLANIKHLQFLWYVFTLLNTLQGVYIFFTFAFTGRVRQMWKTKIGRDNKNDSTGNATTRSDLGSVCI